MSRAVDLLLLGAIAFLGWKLLRSDQSFAGPDEGGSPITVTLRARGDSSLDGLGVIIRAAGELNLAAGIRDAAAPHQLTPWDEDRTAQAIVPTPGRYELRWGAQDEPPPGRPRDVMIQLEESAKAADQSIEVTEGMELPIVIDLGHAHAVGIQSLVRK